MPVLHTLRTETLGRFAAGTASGEESRAVLVHLLSGCADCRLELRRLGGYESAGEADYERVLERLEAGLPRAAAASASTSASTDSLLAELDRLPARQQEILAGNSRRYSRPDLCEELVRRSFDLRFRDPAACLHQARLAAVIARGLSPRDGGAAERHERVALCCRSLGQLANALRLSGDLAAAESALESAHGIVLEEGAPPEVVAEICEMSGALRSYQRRFAESISFYEGAIAIYRDLGVPGLVARALIGQAGARIYAGEPEAALGLLREALPKIGSGCPRLTLAACHTLVFCLADLGRIEEAMLYWVETRPLYDRHGDLLARLRGSWLEGKLFMVQGRYAAAARLLEGARRHYLDLGLAYDAAIVSLDLAPCHLALGRRAEARRLMEVALPVFKSLGIERELLASLRLLARSVAGLEPGRDRLSA